MHTHPLPAPPTAFEDDSCPPPPHASELALRARIANAVWTEVHWLMPRDRPVTITVDRDDIAVTLHPRDRVPS